MKQKEVLLALGWYNHRINEGVASYARKAGWFLNCSYIHQSILPDEWNGDGMITLSGEDEKLNEFVARHSRRVPVVDLAASKPELKCGLVLDDNIAIGQMGAKHFIERQFRQIGFFRTHDSWAANLRQQGFYEQARLVNVKLIDLDCIAHNPQSQKKIYEQLDWLAQRLAQTEGPVGVMAINDEQAVIAMQAARQAGLEVPSQVAVLGVDDDPFAGELAPVPLSSVKTDPVQQGRQAAHLLDKMMAAESAPRKPVILSPQSVIVRRSTDTFAVDDARVAQAMDYIRDNFLKPIGVGDVADFMAMSRRRLHDLFIQNTSQSVHGQITNRRIEHACKLLQDTDWPVKKIAANSGFTSSERMCKTFARDLKITPSRLRNRNKPDTCIQQNNR